MIMLVVIITAYILLLWDFKASYLNAKTEYKIEYHGLLWVGLDYCTILVYKSEDKPMKWINVKIIKL